jgi:hypothetical protein
VRRTDGRRPFPRCPSRSCRRSRPLRTRLQIHAEPIARWVGDCWGIMNQPTENPDRAKVIGAMTRGAGSVIAGLIVALIFVIGVEGVSSILHPFPAVVDPTDVERCESRAAEANQSASGQRSVGELNSVWQFRGQRTSTEQAPNTEDNRGRPRYAGAGKYAVSPDRVPSAIVRSVPLDDS